MLSAVDGRRCDGERGGGVACRRQHDDGREERTPTLKRRQPTRFFFVSFVFGERDEKSVCVSFSSLLGACVVAIPSCFVDDAEPASAVWCVVVPSLLCVDATPRVCVGCLCSQRRDVGNEKEMRTQKVLSLCLCLTPGLIFSSTAVSFSGRTNVFFFSLPSGL